MEKISTTSRLRLWNLSLLTIFVTFLFSACEKEVKIDIPGYEKQLMVDGSIETGQPPFVLLSTSKDIYSPTDLNSFLNSFVSGTNVEVSDGTNTVQLIEICTDNLPPGTESFAAQLFGLPADELANYHLCAYTSLNPLIFGQVGKTYQLKVVYEDKTYTSSSTILPPTPFDSVYWIPANGLADYGYSYVSLTDPVQTKDAYMWEVKRINKGTDGKDLDAGFMKTYNPVFNDEFINGLTFDFWYENPMSYQDENLADDYKGYYQLGDTVVIKFSKLDLAAYEFYEKKYVQLSTGGSPFASPSNIPTNIKGGALGVWSAFSPIFDTLVCKP